MTEMLHLYRVTWEKPPEETDEESPAQLMKYRLAWKIEDEPAIQVDLLPEVTSHDIDVGPRKKVHVWLYAVSEEGVVSIPAETDFESKPDVRRPATPTGLTVTWIEFREVNTPPFEPPVVEGSSFAPRPKRKAAKKAPARKKRKR